MAPEWQVFSYTHAKVLCYFTNEKDAEQYCEILNMDQPGEYGFKLKTIVMDVNANVENLNEDTILVSEDWDGDN